MQNSDIELFFAIYKTKTLTKAAETLFLSQSTVSQRLALLEKEVGVPLFTRSKGQKYVELTSYGEDFLSIAQRWLLLQEEIREIHKNPQYFRLRIAGVHSLNNFLLLPFYSQALEMCPTMELHITNHHSWEIHKLMENRELDIGFMNNDADSEKFFSIPIIKEPFCLITHKDKFPESSFVHPGNLDPGKELYHSWSHDYQQWHDHWWHPDKRSVIHINEPSMLEPFLKHDYWAILPVTAAQKFIDTKPVKIYSLKSPPPDIVRYMTIQKNLRAGSKEAVRIFTQILYKFLETCPYSCLPDSIIYESLSRSHEKRL